MARQRSRRAVRWGSTISMKSGRRNTRCLQCCSRVHRMRVALNRISQLRGDMTPLGVAHGALAQIAQDTSVAKVEREFFDLFIGIGRGELLPYGSYYLTGFLNERPLARLREDLRALGIERAARTAGTGRPCRHPLRNHGRAGEGAFCDNPRRPAEVFRKTCLALDRSIFRRSGARRSRRFLPACGNGRPDIHGD